MSDDLDDDDDEQYAHIAPAEYALPPGQPALQRPPPPRPAGPAPPTRGGMVLTLAGGLLGGSALALGIAWLFNPFDVMGTGMVHWSVAEARKVGKGPIEPLLASHQTFLLAVRNHAAKDPTLWEGVARLARFALDNKKEQGYEIARHLKEEFEHVTPPAHLSELVMQLDELLWDQDRPK